MTHHHLALERTYSFKRNAYEDQHCCTAEGNVEPDRIARRAGPDGIPGSRRAVSGTGQGRMSKPGYSPEALSKLLFSYIIRSARSNTAATESSPSKRDMPQATTTPPLRSAF